MTPAENEQFRFYCVLMGFDLPGFDTWLSTLKGEPVHKELTERRARAWAALRANEEQIGLLHLELMLMRWQWIMRTDALLPLAKLGIPFKRGRKIGTVGAVRKFVRSYMAKHPAAKAAEVWQAIARKPPRGVEVYEASGALLRYIRTTGMPDTSYRQFQNIVSAERPKLP